MKRSYNAEAQKSLPDYINVKDYGIYQKTIDNKQTEMLTVLKIRITP